MNNILRSRENSQGSFRVSGQSGPAQDANTKAKQGSSKIIFDQSKGEQFTLLSGFQKLRRHISNQWSIEHNSDLINEATFEKCRVFVLPCPQAKFYEEECDSLVRFLKEGGSLLVLLNEGGEDKADTNINAVLEQFGIFCNSDAVIRTVFYKYFDPKEALVSNGVLNRAIAMAAGKGSKVLDDSNKSQTLSFVYPHGATLEVTKESVAVLSTGTVCFPFNRPVCALHTTPEGGRLAVLGSVRMFADAYFDKEENSKIFDVVMKFLTDGIELNVIDAAEPDIHDMHYIPDHIQLGGQLKVCLQESEVEQTVFGDFTKLFDASLQTIDLSMWPDTIRAYAKLGIKHEPLSLVVPVFEVPQPPLQPAVFPPGFREISPPQLELFDLDDVFSSPESRLAQITNRCTDDDVELMVKEAGELLGISRTLPTNERTAKRILEHVIFQVVEFKKTNQGTEEETFVNENVNLFNEHEEEEHYFSDIDEYDDLH